MLRRVLAGEIPPPQKNKMLRVDSNARHLLSIINDILDISRIEAGKMPLHLQEFELGAVISEPLAEVAPLIQKARPHGPPDVPAPAPEGHSDPQKVKPIVLHLLPNALK